MGGAILLHITDSDKERRQEEPRGDMGSASDGNARIVVSRKAKPQDLGLTKKVEKS